jgi:hypothetical protein
MPTIGAAVNPETKESFESIAIARKTTASRLAASLIEEYLKQVRSIGLPANQSGLVLPETALAGRGSTKTEQVFVRLDPFYYAELGRLAEERHWYRGSYLANLFIAHVERRPVLCHTEIDAIRQVARQLADLGRNINQIARKLNTSLDNAHQQMSFDFELVKMLLELETSAVKDLIRANVRGWGISDGDA